MAICTCSGNSFGKMISGGDHNTFFRNENWELPRLQFTTASSTGKGFIRKEATDRITYLNGLATYTVQ